MKRKFSRRKEDFACENCGEMVVGNGYTNHCPLCLFSKHVDVNPGDRSNKCRGLMKPISIGLKDGGIPASVTHKCLKCGAIKNNRLCGNDSMETILLIARR